MAQPLPRLPPGVGPPASVRTSDDPKALPPVKPPMATSTTPGMAGVRTDAEFDAFMRERKGGPPVVVQFGSTWCQKCHEILPTYVSLSKQYHKLQYAVAQVDFMKEAVKDIRFSPTFVIYKNGKKVDAVLGKDAQKLEDHLWLHCDE